MNKKHTVQQNRPLFGDHTIGVAERVARFATVHSDDLLDALAEGGYSYWLWWRAVDWAMHRMLECGEMPHQPSDVGKRSAAQFEQLRQEMITHLRQISASELVLEHPVMMGWMRSDDRVCASNVSLVVSQEGDTNG